MHNTIDTLQLAHEGQVLGVYSEFDVCSMAYDLSHCSTMFNIMFRARH